MRVACLGLAVLSALLASGHAVADEVQGQAVPGRLADAREALSAVPQAPPRRFEASLDSLARPTGGHLQGIQCAPSDGLFACYISSSSDRYPYFLRVDFPRSGAPGHVRYLQRLGRGLDHLDHAGGIQLSGNFLAVGLEDSRGRRESHIEFWDVSDPLRARRVECRVPVRRGEPERWTAGAVGLVKQADTYVLVVGNWDSRQLDVYQSNGFDLDHPQCAFVSRGSWSSGDASRDAWEPSRDWGKYQALNLFADASGQLHLIGFHTRFFAWSGDTADLYTLDLSNPEGVALEKSASRSLSLGRGVRFRLAAGARVDSQGRLVLLAGSSGQDGRLVVEASP